MDNLYLGEKIKDTSDYQKLIQQIKEFYNINKFWPTVTELCRLLKWTESKVSWMMLVLQREGYIYKEKHCIRNIRLNLS